MVSITVDSLSLRDLPNMMPKYATTKPESARIIKMIRQTKRCFDNRRRTL